MTPRPDPTGSSEPPEDPREHPTEEPRDDDALWQAIVANYGERAKLDDDEPARPPTPAPSPRELYEAALTPREPAEDPEDHFVPPSPPPMPTPPPARLLAWLGLFGAPLVALVAVVLRVPIAQWLGVILMCWFVGGFLYLVASMRNDGSGHDDGAVV